MSEYKLNVMIELLHMEIDNLETLQGINGKLSYAEVQGLVKRIRARVCELNESKVKEIKE